MEIKEIKAYMKKYGITYALLSEKANVPLNTLKFIFSGRTPTPRIDTMEKITNALGFKENDNILKEEPEILTVYEKLSEDSQNIVLNTAKGLLDLEDGMRNINIGKKDNHEKISLENILK